MNFPMGLCVKCDFVQPVGSHFGLCSCVAKEFAWYVLFWSFLALGWWLVLASYSLMFCVVRSFWFSQVSGLSLLPLDFSFILPIVSRLVQLYSTNNNSSRLMVKRFSTVRDNQRGSQSYMKNGRGRKEIEVSRRREGGTQEERVIVPKVFSVAQTPTKIHRIGLGREGERRK